MLVCTLGDLLLDVVARLDREPVAGSDVTARTALLPGGQAANVAAWVTELGGRARVVAKRGTDHASGLAERALTAHGVEIAGPVSEGRGGIVVSLVRADGERTMVSDRGVGAELRPEELEPAWFACDHLHVSGYLLAVDASRSATARAVELARSSGARISVDLAASTIAETVGATILRAFLESLAPDVVLCNEAEEASIGGPLPGSGWIVKRGARGAMVDGVEHPAVPAETVVDATGAGDAFAAGWIVGGPELALTAASRCVAHVGAAPRKFG